MDSNSKASISCYSNELCSGSVDDVDQQLPNVDDGTAKAAGQRDSSGIREEEVEGAVGRGSGGGEEDQKTVTKGVKFTEGVNSGNGIAASSDHRQQQTSVTTAMSNKRRRTVVEKKVNDLSNLLVESPLFTLSVIAAALAAYVPAGYRANAARFVKAQFGYNSEQSYFYTIGLCYSLAQTVGSMLGGVIVHRMKLTQVQQRKMIISLLAVTMALFLLLFSVECSNAGYVWQNVTGSGSSSKVPATSSCNEKCRCGGDGVYLQLEPVCFSNGHRYFTPCHAGCTRLRQTNSSLVYYDCTRGADAGSSSSSSMESVECVSKCSPTYGAYWFILFFAITAHSMSHVSILLMFLRLVSEKRRTLSLGFAVWSIAVIAFVPGDAIYRSFESTSCLPSMSFKDCHNEAVCWQYDLDRYRYTIHGATVAFLAASVVLFAAVHWLSRQLPENGAWTAALTSRWNRIRRYGATGSSTGPSTSAATGRTVPPPQPTPETSVTMVRDGMQRDDAKHRGIRVDAEASHKASAGGYSRNGDVTPKDVVTNDVTDVCVDDGGTAVQRSEPYYNSYM
jgi:hypothetical protein